jgi:hydroxyethylthiazole kinase-like uncharacterized protein yjeF
MTKTIIQNKVLFPEILWERPVHFYKSKAGKVLILAGSKGMTGAAILASEAVFRSGTGILTLGFPDRVRDFYKDILPEAMTLALPSTLSVSLSKRGHDEILEQSKSCDVALIGPGLSTNGETVQLVWDLLFDLDIPIVLDADGLSALAIGIEVIRKKESEEFMTEYFKKIKNRLILTPHPGEAHRILKAINHKGFDNKKISAEYIETHKAEIAEFISQTIGCITILKGHNTVIAEKGRVIENKVGGPELATAGTGDVLSGIIASFVAQNQKKMFEAAATAVYLHGLAGKLAKEAGGERSVMTSDIIRFLPEAIKRAEAEA